MVCDSLGGGGAERQASLLARSLGGAWQGCVFSLGDGPFAEELRATGVDLTIAQRRFRTDPSPFLELGRTLKRLRPAVVHSWGWMGCHATEIWRRALGIPHVAGVIRRGNLPPRRLWLLKSATRCGDLVLANSRAGLIAFSIPATRGRVLHNGFAPERLALVDGMAAHDGDFRVVMAATVDARKDFGAYLQAIRMFIERCEVRATFSAVGDGPGLAALRSEGADLVADGVLDLPGRVPEVLDHLGHAAATVMLSTAIHGEGISNSIMESMACGLPVVCTASGGNPELVVHGETGFLVPVGDARAVADRLIRLAEDPSDARRMGAAGRRRLDEEFSVTRMLAAAEAIYDEAAGN